MTVGSNSYTDEVRDLCALAGKPGMASAFTASGTPVHEVARTLRDARAEDDRARRSAKLAAAAAGPASAPRFSPTAGTTHRQPPNAGAAAARASMERVLGLTPRGEEPVPGSAASTLASMRRVLTGMGLTPSDECSGP